MRMLNVSKWSDTLKRSNFAEFVWTNSIPEQNITEFIFENEHFV